VSDEKNNLPVKYGSDRKDEKPRRGELILEGKKRTEEEQKRVNEAPKKGELVEESPAELGPVRQGPREKKLLGSAKAHNIFQRILELIPYSHLALIPVFVLLLLPTFSTLGRSFGSMMYPYQLDREEGFIIQQAMDLASGDSIYKPIEDEPYLVGNYPPVYPAMIGGMTYIFSPSLPLGRFVVFFSMLLICAGLMTLLTRDTKALFPGFLAILLFASTFHFADWVAYARVDITAIAFAILGLAAVTSKQRIIGVVIGSLFFILSFYTKQTSVAAPAAAFIGLMFHGEKKLAWIMAGIAGGGCLCLLIFGNMVSGGEFFRHLVTYNKNDMVWSSLPKVLYNSVWFFQQGLLITVLIVLVGAYFLNRFHPISIFEIDLDKHRTRSKALPMAVAYLILSGISLVSVAKVGSASNYFLEFNVAVALLVSLAFGLMTHELQHLTTREKSYVIPVIVLTIVGLFYHGLHLTVFNIPNADFARVKVYPKAPNEYDELIYDYMDEAVAETEGPVLLEEPIFAIRAGKEVVFQPFIMTQLFKEGKWEQDKLLDRIANAEFGLIATLDQIQSEPKQMPGLTDEMQTTIYENYQLHEQIGKYYLYIPKGTKRKIYGPSIV